MAYEKDGWKYYNEFDGAWHLCTRCEAIAVHYELNYPIRYREKDVVWTPEQRKQVAHFRGLGFISGAKVLYKGKVHHLESSPYIEDNGTVVVRVSSIGSMQIQEIENVYTILCDTHEKLSSLCVSLDFCCAYLKKLHSSRS